MDSIENANSPGILKDSSGLQSSSLSSEIEKLVGQSISGPYEVELCPSCGRAVEYDCNCGYGTDWDYAYERR